MPMTSRSRRDAQLDLMTPAAKENMIDSTPSRTIVAKLIQYFQPSIEAMCMRQLDCSSTPINWTRRWPNRSLRDVVDDPSSVEATLISANNNINFPAGNLQPPFNMMDEPSTILQMLVVEQTDHSSTTKAAFDEKEAWNS